MVFEFLEFPTAEQYAENSKILFHKVTWTHLLLEAWRLHCLSDIGKDRYTVLRRAVRRLMVCIEHDSVAIRVYLNCLTVVFGSGVEQQHLYPSVLTWLHEGKSEECVASIYAIESLVYRNARLAVLNRRFIKHGLVAP